jgi:Ni/Co efflux regulator RcnB
MRKLLISLLLASAAASPALAAPATPEERAQARAERQQARSDARPARESRSQAQPAPAPRAAPPAGFVGPQPANTPRNNNFVRQQPVDAPRNNGFVRPAPGYAPRDNGFVRPEVSGGGGRPDVNGFRARRDATVQQQQQPRDGQVDPRAAQRDPRQQTRGGPWAQRGAPAPGTQPPRPTRPRYTAAPNWNTGWRNDHRYDWRNQRNRNRSQFHLGIYNDPFGWGYQRYSIGWRMWPNYFSSSFWINDPWQYRLPYAPPGTQWVRYYDDAVLVDMWSGEVVDVIYNFFW